MMNACPEDKPNGHSPSGKVLPYIKALDALHEVLQPRSYVEIGCKYGLSLSRARCPSIAIDPAFNIQTTLRAPTRLFRETSDEFFARNALSDVIGAPFDLAFIDGMHLSEYVLRDFINLERYAHNRSVVAIDDVLPREIAWAQRERQTQAWTGDVYKVIPLLRSARPDLRIEVFEIGIKGLALVSNLDSGNRVLRERYEELEARLVSSALDLKTAEAIKDALKPSGPELLKRYVTDLAQNGGGHTASGQVGPCDPS